MTCQQPLPPLMVRDHGSEDTKVSLRWLTTVKHESLSSEADRPFPEGRPSWQFSFCTPRTKMDLGLKMLIVQTNASSLLCVTRVMDRF